MSITIADTWNKKDFEVAPSRPLNVYICGPTVYSHTHVGHLKTYMTFDIVRRILTDYFKIPVTLMMNITNVDDKIIRGTYQKEYGESVVLDELNEEDFLDRQKFVDFADYWEKDFFDILDMVGVRRPDVVSRVTEYIPEILDFVRSIDSQGFAFEHEGSVYFYGTKFNDSKEDGNDYSKDPSNPLNFVLLKKTKPYEPGWESEWGTVRPGWHIECSAMASSVFGQNFDIHGGGIDLRFPHHHNEMQQSNARFYGTGSDPEKQWVNHFMHTGQLKIDGLKMSKSLKNFITSREILTEFSAQEIRMLFLLHRWSEHMDYSEETMHHAQHYQGLFQNFMMQTQNILMRKTTVRYKKFGKLEIKYQNILSEIREAVDQELRQNLNTPAVIKKLQEATTNAFQYVMEAEAMGSTDQRLVENYRDFVSDILRIFGIETEGESSGKEQDLIKVIQDIRTEVRVVARDIGKKVKPLDKALSRELPKELYELTDRVRDQILPDLGFTLTDR